MNNHHTFFRIYVCICLFLIVILLAAMVGAITYGSLKVKDESKTLTTKVNIFSGNLNTVNSNLQGIEAQLQKQNSLTSKDLSSL